MAGSAVAASLLKTKNMKHLLLFLFVAFTVAVDAQVCSESIYDSVKQLTQRYEQKADESLLMDIFSPEPDTLARKPVLVYVHGGGFAGGSRNEERHLQFCRRFARKGFVAVTIDYTLHMKGKSFGCERPSQEKINTFLKTGQDISKAVKHLVNQHQELGIDTNKIVLAGSSAGAEAVLHAAYWEATRSDTTQQILSKAFRYGGVISMAGAITDINWITKASAIPTQLFHGTCDPLVPYGTAAHHYCPPGAPGYLMLFGAQPIMKRLESLDRPYYSVVGCHGQHEWNILPLLDYEDDIVDFMINDVMKKDHHRQMLKYINTGKAPCKALPDVAGCSNEK
jgi:dienelactone hydrolase